MNKRGDCDEPFTPLPLPKCSCGANATHWMHVAGIESRKCLTCRNRSIQTCTDFNIEYTCTPIE